MVVGVVGMLLAAFLYAVYFKLYERLGKVTNTRTIIFWQFLIVTIVVSALWGNIQIETMISISYTSWFYLLILTLFCTLGGYAFAILSIKKVGALVTGTVDFLEPLIGVALAIVILNESISMYQIVGWFLVLFTIFNIKKIK